MLYKAVINKIKSIFEKPTICVGNFWQINKCYNLIQKIVVSWLATGLH